MEDAIVVNGTGVLRGDVDIAGAKNSALKLLPAALLGAGESVIDNVPLISDMEIMSEVLEQLGASVRRDEHRLFVDTIHVDSFETPYTLVSKMRASTSVLGPLIGRFGHARVAMPGGCQIGARKIDMHLAGLEQLGVKFTIDHGFMDATTPNGLRGADIRLVFPSVGATENLLMAAVVAKGTTVLRNAAREPEIVDLCNMLVAMGARIFGIGTTVLTVEGVNLSDMHPCTHRVVGDRIEAGTFLVGGALTGGPVCVHGVDPAHLAIALKKLNEFGCVIEACSPEDDAQGRGWIRVSRAERSLRAASIQTLPFPGFPTDLQAQFMLLAACAQGTSVVTENVFENRFMFAAELMRMGADITINDHHAIVRGVPCLQGAPVLATDLRAGAALVLAGLVAEGETTIYNPGHVDRGYEDYVGKLCRLGATVKRVGHVPEYNCAEKNCAEEK